MGVGGKGSRAHGTGKGRGEARERGGILRVWGIGLGWKGKEIWGDAFGEAEKCEPGAERSDPLSKEHQGKREACGVCLLPQCPTWVFSTDSAVSFLPCKSKDPNSMSFRIINGTHLLLGTRCNYKIVFLRLRGLICYLLFSAPQGNTERRCSLFH